jgi:ubiquinone/menaquinone biosynthesis C-methylase UbiE
MEVKNILHAQYDKIVNEWDKSIERYYPDYFKEWSEPDEHVHSLNNKWNTRVAANNIDWESIFNKKENLIILDAGCGTGWLSSDFSKYDKVQSIVALDSSMFNLNFMLPKIFNILGGKIEKVIPTRGLFNPLEYESQKFDLIVMSSAIHHSPNIENTLIEFRRVLKDDGAIILCNETPLTNYQYLLLSWKKFISINISILKNTYFPLHSISNNGIQYDPYLGDTSYTFNQFVSYFRSANLSYEIIRDKLFPYKNQKRQKSKLVHFILRKK